MLQAASGLHNLFIWRHSPWVGQKKKYQRKIHYQVGVAVDVQRSNFCKCKLQCHLQFILPQLHQSHPVVCHVIFLEGTIKLPSPTYLFLLLKKKKKKKKCSAQYIHWVFFSLLVNWESCDRILEFSSFSGHLSPKEGVLGGWLMTFFKSTCSEVC